MMKLINSRIAVLGSGLLAIAMAVLPSRPAQASRADRANSLSDCVAKADIIVIGIVDAKSDREKDGLIHLRVLLEPFKGKVESKELTIADPFFRSAFKGSPEGPVIVESKHVYLFFLRTLSGENYQLFNSHDGVVPPCGPVILEIENLVGSKR